jgi:uncharacterized repeat protein (TIGR03833 family)
LKHFPGVISKPDSGYRQVCALATWYDYLESGLSNMSGTERKNIKPGLKVSIVLKTDQGTGKLTEGIVKDILTKSSNHPHGIKVRLESGQIGRVKEIKIQ